MPNATNQPTNLPNFLQTDPAWEDQKRRLWAMSAQDRVDAMRAGKLSLRLCLHWAARAPREVPLVNGEWEFIAARTPDLGDADEHAKQRARVAESLVRRPDADEVSHRGVLR